MADKPTYYTVTESFALADGDYQKGDVVTADDPILKKVPLHFEPLVVRAPYGKPATVEQATAAPGEKRDLPAGKALTTASVKGHG